MRRGELLLNILFVGPMIIVAIVTLSLVMYMNSPRQYVISILILYCIGFSMFLKAKISVMKEGRLLSFGTKYMTQSNRNLYIYGYIIMGIGLILSLVLILSSFKGT